MNGSCVFLSIMGMLLIHLNFLKERSCLQKAVGEEMSLKNLEAEPIIRKGLQQFRFLTPSDCESFKKVSAYFMC